jgi:hypothetical protein
LHVRRLKNGIDSVRSLGGKQAMRKIDLPPPQCTVLAGAPSPPVCDHRSKPVPPALARVLRYLFDLPWYQLL